MDHAESGRVLAGRYRLLAVIGSGGMGVVWLARDELLDRNVAVKEIRWPPQLDTVQRETIRQRALREARTAARLNHPNIVGVYDVIEDDRRPWIVMQFVPYRSLGDAVQEDGPLSPGAAAKMGLEILAALRAAHAIGVLHRDVKPGNILLGPGNEVVLTDFGMAIAHGSPTLTTSGVLIGSPSYMAPERARGEPATPAADLWSLGATLYAAVEGRPPFHRDGTMAVLTAVVNDEPDPPSRAGALWLVISALLSKDPGARPGAHEVERMLRRVLAGQGGSPEKLIAPLAEASSSKAPARQASPPAEGVKATTLPQWQAGGTRNADAGPALIPGLEPSVHVLEEGPQEPGSPPLDGRPRRRNPRLRWLFAAIALVAAVAAIAAAIGVASKNAPRNPAAPPAQQASPSASAPQPSASPGPGSAPPSTGSGALPAGFVRYHDPAGFSIGVPARWQVSHNGHLLYVADPSSSRFLIVDSTNHPKSDPLADWRQQEANRISTYPGYHRLRLQAVYYAQAEKAADWEFTYYQNGQLVHVLNRNILADPDHAYALYWSTPASEWDASFRLFEAFAATFRPASTSPRPGS